MERRELIVSLKGLREEIEQDGGVRIIDLETSFALALSDVCDALGFTAREHDEVLGQEAAAHVAGIRQTRFWPVQGDAEGETADIFTEGVLAARE